MLLVLKQRNFYTKPENVNKVRNRLRRTRGKCSEISEKCNTEHLLRFRCGSFPQSSPEWRVNLNIVREKQHFGFIDYRVGIVNK